MMRVSESIIKSISSGKEVFNKAEMKSHRCVRRAKDGSEAESGGA